MAEFDFRTTRKPLDYRLPPEVFQLLAQATQQKNQMYQGLGQSLGQGVGAGIEAYGENKKGQKEQTQILDFLKTQTEPIQRNIGGVPVAAYDPGTDTLQSTDPNPRAKYFQGMEKLPLGALQKIIGPMILAEEKQGLKNSAPLSRGMQAEVDMANKKYAAGGPGTPKGRMFEARADQSETSALSLIEKNLDPSTAGKNTPIGAAAQSVRRILNATKLLNQKDVTKTALEATLVDIDSILTQASATVEGTKMLGQTNIYQNAQNLKAFLSSQPDKVNVTPAMKNLYFSIIKDLGPVAQSFVIDRVKQQGELWRSRGEKLAGPQQYNAMIDRITKSFTLPSNLMQDESSPSDMKAGGGGYSDPKKEARYQEWLKTHGQ